MIKQISKRSQNISFAMCWKSVGTLVRPNGITVYSKCLYRVQKVVFHSSPGRIRTRLYVPHKSIFVKNFAPLTCSKRLEIMGSACTYSWWWPYLSYSNQRRDKVIHPFSWQRKCRLEISNVEWTRSPNSPLCRQEGLLARLVTSCRSVYLIKHAGNMTILLWKLNYGFLFSGAGRSY